MMHSTRTLSLSAIALYLANSASAQTAASALASALSLTTSTSLPFPTATLGASDANTFIVQGWSLSKGRIQNGADRIAFVNDPFTSSITASASGTVTTSSTPSGPQIISASGVTVITSAVSPAATPTSTGPVLKVTYPANAFGSNSSGMQLENLWNTSDGSAFDSMVLSYEVAFDQGFEFVKGGKMAGLRGGQNHTGCSGGNKPNGTDCFSTRTMWRKGGAGEVYAYIPTPNGLCKDDDIICNSDFGTSIHRGSFSFLAGEWNRITLVVQMNDPVDTANGNVELYYNDVKAFQQDNLQLRASKSVNINGLYLSTFYGGSDSSWAPSSEMHTYFRNFQMWGGSSASNLTGAHVSASISSRSTVSLASLMVAGLASIIAMAWV
ncbi:hypothetical protein PUNSTDRAFT_142064 [Punctularia strigosozonata HHB-11173 SS5]|uniref:uncharacterized protein n=1 Tax=Punctularia strigosozonata (strain HHB-11173) TaxID=741275 RepID=UPI0004417828|nr:uncharacterized protein PUNSTDRAFT_142064 [Punctularia strigosozonata HHB-11173 SS5]EIN11822.1 hypothetical protein PUNSTDRAFT_142064 [Punctularia strigosozonata HHB-11173 SS5]